MSEIQNVIRQALERIRDERQTAQNTATRVGSAMIMLLDYLTGDDSPFLSKEHDDEANGIITFLKGLVSMAYTQFAEGADFGQFVTGMLGGQGARIDKHGNMEATSLVLRSFLEVPKLVYNHVDVRVGDEWQTNGAGEIESSEIDTDRNGDQLNTGTIHLKLVEGEYGTLKVGDRCKGIYHNLEGHNDTVTADDGKGGRTFAGFYTSFFVITGVSGVYNETLRYELRPTVVVDGLEYWQTDEGTSSGIRGGQHPQAHMVFAQYSNPTDSTRQSCQYRTTTYTRMLTGMTGWDEGLVNVAFQVGNTPLIGSAYNIPDAGNYSLWINGDIYFAGTLNRVDSWGRPITDFPDQGDWDNATTYRTNDLVHWKGVVWRCVAATQSLGGEPGVSGDWVKWIFAESIKPEGHWQSTKVPYAVNSIVNLYTNIYMSVRTTRNAPMTLLKDQDGNYITKEDGGYIIIDDTTNEDWIVLLNVGDITNGLDGENTVAVNLTNDTDSVLTDEKGNVIGSLPQTTAQLYDGLMRISQGVVWSIASVAGCTASINSATGLCTVTKMTADEAKVVIVANYNDNNYSKEFTFKKLYGRDKLWLELTNDVIKYDVAMKTYSPHSLTLQAYRASVQGGEREQVTSDSLGWIQVGSDTRHLHHGDTVNISNSVFTNGHLIIILYNQKGEVQDVEDIILIEDTLQVAPAGRWTSTLEVQKNNVVEFYNGTFMAKKNSIGVPPVMSLLKDQNGNYITREDGGYIIINDAVNEEYWMRMTYNGAKGNDSTFARLDNNNDVMVYDGAGNLVTGSCTANASLYAGNRRIDDGELSWRIKERSNVTASISGNKVTVTSISADKGYVIIAVKYEGAEYTCEMNVSRVVGVAKYEIVTSPQYVGYNPNTSAYTDSSVSVDVYLTSQKSGRVKLTELPDDYVLRYTAGGTVRTLSPGNAIPQAHFDGNVILVELIDEGGTLLDREEIPFISDGQNGDNGSEGLQGCCTRASEWKSGQKYRNDTGKNMAIGYIDVVGRAVATSVSADGWRFYRLKKDSYSGDSYTSTTAPENDTNHWELLSGVGPIYTSLLIAINAFIKFGSTNQFVIVDSNNKIQAGLKGDGNIRIWAGGGVNYSPNGQPSDSDIENAKFKVDKEGNLYANEAHLEKAEVEGTIHASLMYSKTKEAGTYTIDPANDPAYMYTGAGELTLPPVSQWLGLELKFYIPYSTMRSVTAPLELKPSGSDKIGIFANYSSSIPAIVRKYVNTYTVPNGKVITLRAMKNGNVYSWDIIDGDLGGLDTQVTIGGVTLTFTGGVLTDVS